MDLSNNMYKIIFRDRYILNYQLFTEIIVQTFSGSNHFIEHSLIILILTSSVCCSHKLKSSCSQPQRDTPSFDLIHFLKDIINIYLIKSVFQYDVPVPLNIV